MQCVNNIDSVLFMIQRRKTTVMRYILWAFCIFWTVQGLGKRLEGLASLQKVHHQVFVGEQYHSTEELKNV